MTDDLPGADAGTAEIVKFPGARLDEAVPFAWAISARRALTRFLLRTPIARHRRLITQFVQFGSVGTTGFVVDSAFVYTAHFAFGVGLIPAGLLSFVVAATSTWFLNRIWTFRGSKRGRIHHEWLRYLATNSAGFVLNRGVYVALIATSSLCNLHPALALAAGSIAGLGVNFSMSRLIVFR
jgi:putative flippase GtrA